MESLDLFSSSPQAAEPRGRFSRESLSRELNPAQLQAALHPPAPLVIVAGAGSGKTRVITFRLARMVATGEDPRRILVVTFTNKAAGELRERAARLLGTTPNALGGLTIGTFHSVAVRLLRRYGEAIGMRKDFVIYDDDDQRRLMTRILHELKVPDKQFPPRQVLSAIDRAKNQGTSAASYSPVDSFDEVIGRVWTEYESRLRASNAIDFGGLLTSALDLCRQDCPAAPELFERFDHVLVDEFQDTNAVQYRLVRFLSRRTGSITVVGDEDQSIYKWRGADIRNILDFEKDHPGAGVVKLEQNYRSSGNVLEAANAIIAHNRERRPKRLFTEAVAGDPLIVFEGETERDEAEFVASTIDRAIREEGNSPRDFAIFYRTNGQARVLEEVMRSHDIPYVVVGGTRFFDRAEVKDLIAYLRVVSNPDDEVSLLRIINTPTRGIGDTTVDRVIAFARERRVTVGAALALAAEAPDVLGAAARGKLGAFVELMAGLRAAAPGLGPAALAEKVLEESGYRDMLAGDASLEAEGRLENLMELVAQMREYESAAEDPTLTGFLERVALVSDIDGYDPEKGAASLMTVHTAKGLEFPWVFLTGLEENIFPHARSVDDDTAIEEERRLCYVAVTRAMKRLYLSRVRRRRLGGQTLFGPPSRFLKDVPTACAEYIVQPQPAYLDEDTAGAGPWGGQWNRGGQSGGYGGRPGGGGGFGAARAARGFGAGASRGGASQGGGYGASSRPGSSPAQRSGAQPAAGVTVHYDDGAAPGAGAGDELGLRIGARLRHAQFGVGEVRGWQGEGRDLKITLRFSTAGVKTVLARFLQRP